MGLFKKFKGYDGKDNGNIILQNGHELEKIVAEIRFLSDQVAGVKAVCQETLDRTEIINKEVRTLKAETSRSRDMFKRQLDAIKGCIVRRKR